MGLLRRLREWRRRRWLCECCRVDVKGKHVWTDRLGGKLCDACMAVRCPRDLSTDTWGHRVPGERRGPDGHCTINLAVRQDVVDLHEAWLRAVDECDKHPSPANSAKAVAAYEALADYLHEIPVTRQVAERKEKLAGAK